MWQLKEATILQKLGQLRPDFGKICWTVKMTPSGQFLDFLKWSGFLKNKKKYNFGRRAVTPTLPSVELNK